METTTAKVTIASLFLLCVGCSKEVPSEVQAVIDAQHAAAVEAADKAVKLCPDWKGRAGLTGVAPIDAPKPAHAHPAKGTSLESEGSVRDVFTWCSWPDPKGPSGVQSGTAMPPLKGARVPPMTRAGTVPGDYAKNTCKDGVVDCERIVVPSRYASEEKSADLVVERALPGGGRMETIVVIVP